MLEDIKKDIERLIAAYEAAKVENRHLKNELQKCREENESYRKQNTELEKDIDNLKLAQAFLGTTSSKSEAKERINKMIHSIDKCIALMEK